MAYEEEQSHADRGRLKINRWRYGRLLALFALASLLLIAALASRAGASHAAVSRTADTHIFVPAVTSRQQGPGVVFAVIGDFGSGDRNEAAVSDLVLGWSPSFIVSVGDNYYKSAPVTNTNKNKYNASVGRFYCRYLAHVAGSTDCPAGKAVINSFFAALGNHDYTEATPAPQTYLHYFTLPGTGVQSNNTSRNERYYDFVRGPVHFFVLDSDSREPDGVSSKSKQARWLKAQLAASTATWNVVAFHHPPYSSDKTHGPTTYMQWPFAEWGADVVLTGHAHDYERIMRDGMVYFVNGLGGATIYQFVAPVTGSAFRYNAKHGAQRVTATDRSLKFEFISVDGTVQDTYTLTK